jgi:hypothetical protein
MTLRQINYNLIKATNFVVIIVYDFRPLLESLNIALLTRTSLSLESGALVMKYVGLVMNPFKPSL